MDDGISRPRPTDFNNQNFGTQSFNGYADPRSANNNFMMPAAQPGFNNAGRVRMPPRRSRPEAAHRAFKALFVFFFMIAAILIVITVFVISYMRKSYNRCTAETEGTVIENIVSTSKSGSNKGSVTPVFEYEVNGKKYVQKSSVSEKPARHKVGEKVTVHYNPDRPTEYYVDKVDGLVMLVLGCIAAFFMAFAIMFGVLSVKEKHNAQRMMQ